MKPHGKIELSWNKNALIINTYGPFNLEGITIAFEQIKHSVALTKPVAWYRLDLLDDETLGCPQVMKVIGDSYKWSLCNGCPEIMVACHNQIQTTLLNQFIHYTGLNIKAFSCKEAAISYLNDK